MELRLKPRVKRPWDIRGFDSLRYPNSLCSILKLIFLFIIHLFVLPITAPRDGLRWLFFEKSISQNMEKTEIRMHNGKLLTPVRIDSNTYVLVSPERVTPNFAEEWKDRAERSRQLTSFGRGFNYD